MRKASARWEEDKVGLIAGPKILSENHGTSRWIYAVFMKVYFGKCLSLAGVCFVVWFFLWPTFTNFGLSRQFKQF